MATLLAIALFAEPAGASSVPLSNAHAHWAFQLVQRPAMPALQDPEPVLTAVDAFLSERLRSEGIVPVPDASRQTLIRRLAYDLTGLPPDPAHTTSFVDDPDPGAWERLVERYLASPGYGETWGKHWLDVVRYADTAGETADFPVPQAWRYRNYVIDAFNADKPFDRFVREQIAGDILAAESLASGDARRAREEVVATGFLAVSRRFGFDSVQDHYLTLEDTIDTLGKSVLGLSLGCARCHDHKHDPVSTADYYGLYGIFESTQYPLPGCEKTKTPSGFQPLPAADSGGSQPSELAYAVADGEPHDAEIHVRGNNEDRGPVTPRKNLELLGGEAVRGSGSGRLELAGWLTDPANPLTARVLVNRLWQHHFGRGLVATPNDFGTAGDPPAHPALLDWLASELIDSGWSVKHVQRAILLSAAYRRSSAPDGSSSGTARDPGNRLWWRAERRRLDAEEIRDSLLHASGELDLAQGQAHPFPPESSWQFTQHSPFLAEYEHRLRSVYLMRQRIRSHSFFALFDGADPSASTGQRLTTTVAPQALYFMNNPFVHAQAEAFAERLRSEGNSEEERLRLGWSILLGTEPGAEAVTAGREFLQNYAAALGEEATPPEERERRAWSAWCRILFTSNAFLYVD